MVIFRLVTGSKDVAFRGFVNTFVVTRKPFRSKGSGCAMATFLEVSRRGEWETGESRNGRMSGASTNRERKLKKGETRMAREL